MIQIRNIAKLGLITLITAYSSTSYSATIIVNTTDMAIDVAGREFISLDTSTSPVGRSGLYQADTLTITDLNDISKNPADDNTGKLTVGDTSDDKPAISLPEAIIAANNTAGSDTIVLQIGETYEALEPHNYWYGSNALPPITSIITIRGDGLPEGDRPQQTDKAAVIQRATSADNMRLFFVMGGSYTSIITGKAQVGFGSLSLVNLHIKNGNVKGGNGSGGGAGLGGAIFNQGSLNLNGVTFSENKALGGDGSSTAGLGGGGVGGDAIAALGGGFFNTFFIGGETTTLNDADGEEITQSIFGGNGGSAGSGGFGPQNHNGANGGGPSAIGSTHPTLGAFGAGGGRAANSPTEDGNSGAFGNGGGYGVTGGPGGFGGGGGQSSSASNESTAGFAGGKGSSISGGGGAGLGGAIFNHSGLLIVLNSTFSDNQVEGGEGDFGGSAYGAAIFSSNAQSISFGNTSINGINIIHSTIFDNACTAGSGTNGTCNSPVYILGITGAGVQDGLVDATATITNSIIANPESISYASLSNNKLGSNSGSTVTISGKNIIRQTVFNGTDATLNQNSANIIDQGPFVNAEVLDANAGLTPVIIPSVTSPAIDSADSDATTLAIQSGLSNLLLDQQRKPRLKLFIKTPEAPGTPATPEVLEALPTNIGSVETGANTAPEIIFLTRDKDGNQDDPKVADNSSVLLSSLFSIRDLDDPLQISSLDMQLTLLINDGNGSFKIATQLILDIRERGLTFLSTPEFAVSDGVTPPETVSLTSISLTAPPSNISQVLSRTIFEPAAGLGGGSNDFSEIAITIDDLGIAGDTPSANLTDNKILKVNITGTPPEVGIGSNINTIGNTAFPLVILFSEPVTGFDISDITATNATIVGNLVTFTEQQFFQANIQPNGQGNIQIEIPANAVEDDLGLKNTASNVVNIRLDINQPTITTSGIPSTAGNTEFTANFVFNEEVSGFTVEDIQVSNASLSDFTEVSPSSYSVVITPDQISGVRFSIKEKVASDAAGNGNKALPEQLIPLQGGGDSSSSAYTPIFSLMMLGIYLLRRRVRS